VERALGKNAAADAATRTRILVRALAADEAAALAKPMEDRTALNSFHVRTARNTRRGKADCSRRASEPTVDSRFFY